MSPRPTTTELVAALRDAYQHGASPMDARTLFRGSAAELVRLQTALEQIRDSHTSGDRTLRIARAALEAT